MVEVMEHLLTGKPNEKPNERITEVQFATGQKIHRPADPFTTVSEWYDTIVSFSEEVQSSFSAQLDELSQMFEETGESGSST